MTKRCVITLHCRACAHPRRLKRSGAPRAANGDTLFSPWHHPPLLLLKKETNIHPEGTGDGERKRERERERERGRRARKGELNPPKPVWHEGQRHINTAGTKPGARNPRRPFSLRHDKRPLFLSSREKLHRFLAGDDLGLFCFFFFFLTRMNNEVSSGKQQKEGCLAKLVVGHGDL